jgi:CheY-like chemotaxis protein
MDTSAVYSKTGKGLAVLKSASTQLSMFEARVLSLVDGKSNVLKLAAMLHGASEPVDQLLHALTALEKLGLIHLYHLNIQEETTTLPTIQASEIYPPESMQIWAALARAWAEARRGAIALKEKGFYQPLLDMHHVAHREDGHTNRLLVVERNATTAKVMGSLFKDHNFQVMSASDSMGAFKQLEQDPLPDVVLLDRDAFPILHHIRMTPRLSQLPVILVTTNPSEAYVMRGLKEGADGYVSMPFKWETIAGCIKKALQAPNILS